MKSGTKNLNTMKRSLMMAALCIVAGSLCAQDEVAYVPALSPSPVVTPAPLPVRKIVVPGKFQDTGEGPGIGRQIICHPENATCCTIYADVQKSLIEIQQNGVLLATYTVDSYTTATVSGNTVITLVNPVKK
jgi:hypothetical protein